MNLGEHLLIVQLSQLADGGREIERQSTMTQIVWKALPEQIVDQDKCSGGIAELEK